MDKDNGGPAFPHVGSEFNNDSCEREMATTAAGMTLRDYFAAKAMQAGLTGASLPGLHEGNPETMSAVRDVAVAFYAIADAMLAARNAG